jgi:hypothetical protein
MLIYVQTPGFRWKLTVNETDCVRRIKAEMYVITGDCPCKQKLTFDGKLLEDLLMLSDYGITNGSTINIKI